LLLGLAGAPAAAQIPAAGAAGAASTTLFLSTVDPRTAFFYGRRPDSATVARTEDDYVITEKGLERISTVPREIGEIETIMHTRPPRAVP
jgi:hypothetical protein